MPKNLIPHALESVPSVGDIKRHTKELIHAEGCHNGSLLDVLSGDKDLVVVLLQVQLEEDGSTCN